jgi:hypothetical protein
MAGRVDGYTALQQWHPVLPKFLFFVFFHLVASIASFTCERKRTTNCSTLKREREKESQKEKERENFETCLVSIS